MVRFIFGPLLGLLLLATAANAQQTPTANVYATCGTASYTAGGSPQPITVDTTGNLCDNGGGGGTPTNPSTVTPATNNKVSGTANTTGTGSTSLIGAVTSNRIYVTGFSCANTGASAALVSFQDGSGGTTLWTTIVPAGSGSNSDGTMPLFWTTAGNALYVAFATGSTTNYCSAAGFSGP